MLPFLAALIPGLLSAGGAAAGAAALPAAATAAGGLGSALVPGLLGAAGAGVAANSGGGSGLWGMLSKILPQVAGSMGQGATGGNIIGGQAQPQQPYNQFIPPQIMPSRNMPSYGNIIQQMLAKYRG